MNRENKPAEKAAAAGAPNAPNAPNAADSAAAANAPDALRALELAHERDRRMLACELHDGLVQDIVAAKMLIEGLLSDLDAGHTIDRDQLVRVEQLLGRAIGEGRRMISQLRPLVLDERDLPTAIDYLARQWAAEDANHVEFVFDAELPALDANTRGSLFRIVQEALTNAFRHSGEDAARVELRRRGGTLELTIRDEGSGFEPDGVPRDRFGLTSIRDRAQLLGGKAEIVSGPGRGTTVRVEVPIP